MKKNYKNLFLSLESIIICMVLLLTSISIKAQTYDYNVLRARVFQDNNYTSLSTSSLDTWVTSQNSNGSWSDTSYGNITNTNNSNSHVYRLWNIAVACTKTGHEKYNDASYKNAVKNGLKYWYDSNSTDSNWWYNEVYFPQRLGEILIFMREFDGFIPKTSATGIDEPEILSLFKPSSLSGITSRGGAANAIDIGTQYVYRGLLSEDGSLLENTRDRLEAILVDNIKGDLMYQDHGPQVMVASYGWVFCDGLMRLASYMAGSPAAFNTNTGNFSKVLSFIKETQVSAIRGRAWDFSVNGRGISRENGLNANLNYLQIVADFIDPANANTYQDILDRLNGSKAPNYNINELNKHYWVSDYTQQSRSNYLFTVRNTSTRTVECETGNGENLKANYLSYGANFLSIDGDEYLNIMPIWDWSMIPGTTFPYITTFPNRSAWGTNFGSTTFVGGVSDGLHGASVLDLDEAGIKAKKSWFFFEDEMVCLGAGIVDGSNRNVRTTINQSWFKELAYYSELGSSTETSQSISSVVRANSNLKYIRSGKFGYYFPNQGDVKYTIKSQTGTWKSINTGGSTDSKSGYVFSLWFDHGNNPSAANYSYIVVPGIDTEQKAQNYDASLITILENSTSKQAVYHSGLDILQIIFYEAGTLTFGNKSVTVNNACALMVKNGSIVTVSNPAQTHSGVSVTLKVGEVSENKAVTLPNTSEMKGSSVTVNFDNVLSVNDFSGQETKTTIYPNPTKGVFNIKTTKNDLLNYKVASIEGKTILTGQFRGETILDLSKHARGMYFITLTDDHKFINTLKVIKN